MQARRGGKGKGKAPETDGPSAALEALNDLLTSLLIPISLPSLSVATPSLLLAALESLLEQRLPLDDAVRTSRTHQARQECLSLLLSVLEEVLAGTDNLPSWRRSSRIDPDALLAGSEREVEKVVWALTAVAKRKGVVGEVENESGVYSPFVKALSRASADTGMGSRAYRTAGRRFGIKSLESQEPTTKLGAMLAPIARRPTTPRSAHRHALSKMTVPTRQPHSGSELSTDVEDSDGAPAKRRPRHGQDIDDDDPFLSDETRRTLVTAEIEPAPDRPFVRALSSTPAKTKLKPDAPAPPPTDDGAPSSLCSCDSESATEDARPAFSISALLADLPELPPSRQAENGRKGKVVVLPAREGACLPVIADDVERFERARSAASSSVADVEDGGSASQPSHASHLDEYFDDAATPVDDVDPASCGFSDSDDDHIRTLKARKAVLLRRLYQLCSGASSSSASSRSRGRSVEVPDGAVVRIAVRKPLRKELDFSGMERRRLVRS